MPSAGQVTIADIKPCCFRAQPMIDDFKMKGMSKDPAFSTRANKPMGGTEVSLHFPPIKHTRRSVLAPGITKERIAQHQQRYNLQSASSSPIIGISQKVLSRQHQTKSAEVIQPTPETTANKISTDTRTPVGQCKRLLRGGSSEATSHPSSESSAPATKHPTSLDAVNLRNKTPSATPLTSQTSSASFQKPERPKTITEDTFNRCCEWLKGVQGAQKSTISLESSTLPPVRWSQESKK